MLDFHLALLSLFSLFFFVFFESIFLAVSPKPMPDPIGPVHTSPNISSMQLALSKKQQEFTTQKIISEGNFIIHIMR